MHITTCTSKLPLCSTATPPCVCTERSCKVEVYTMHDRRTDKDEKTTATVATWQLLLL